MSRVICAALLLALAAACGASKTRRSAQPESALVPEAPHVTRQQEIQDLFMQIREWRAESDGLDGVEPRLELIREMEDAPDSIIEDIHKMCTLPAEPADACRDECDIAEHICENAEAICRIARELGDDPWAQEKCASAKASCKEAKEQCCKCQGINGDE